MTELFQDFETYSTVDLKKVGGARYARDPSTRALMLAYAFDDEKIEQWVPAEGQPMPRDLRDGMRDPQVIKRAWNAPFEIGIWRHVLKVDIDVREWRCSMVRALALSFPGYLEKACPIVDMPDDMLKDPKGRRLMGMFSSPQKRKTKKNPFTRFTHYTHPEEWEEYKAYNIQDVNAERGFDRRTSRWDLPDWEWELWFIDQEINDRGIPVNVEVVENAIRFLEHVRADRFARMRELSGVDNPRSNAQLLEWLKAEGYRFDDMKKAHVLAEYEDPESEASEDAIELLGLRLEVARTSPDKYYAIKRALCDDNTVKGAFQFCAAGRTWRWGGRIFQPQNLPRPDKEFEDDQAKHVSRLERCSPKSLELLYDKPMDFLASMVRPTVQAKKGEVFCIADLNAIENRVLGWLADDRKILNVFALGRDPYIDFATYMYGEAYDDLYADYEEGDKSKRTVAKPGVLGCGYMLSAGEERKNRSTGEIEASGLLGYAWNMGIKDFTLEDAKLSVRVWRETFKEAVAFWWEIENAAKKCLRTGKETWAGYVGFDRSGPFMRMLLPSGRELHYCRPRLEEVDLYWCEKKRKYLPLSSCKQPNMDKSWTKEQITYEGLDDKKRWMRITTHPGKLTENADQAISRDLLAHGMLNAEDEGLKVRIHVHDELIVPSPEDRAEETLALLVECMEDQPDWAKGLPLKAAGVMSPVWIKD